MKEAIYARVSAGRQAENDSSIPDQVKRMKRYCKTKGWSVEKVCIEPSASARYDKRPMLQDMMSDTLGKEHPFDLILTLTTARFFREK